MVRAKPSTKSEVARSSECTEQYAQKVFDNADIVRDAIYRQQSFRTPPTLPRLSWIWPRVTPGILRQQSKTETLSLMMKIVSH